MLNRFAKTGWYLLWPWFLAVAAGCSHAADKPVPAADAKAVQTVVAAQLAAFAQGDAVKAFSFASPEIRKAFSTPKRFMEMARIGYAPLFQPSTVTFFKPEPAGKAVLQRLQLAGPDGALWIALYSLQRQPDGQWRITGCTLAVSEGLQTRLPVANVTG